MDESQLTLLIMVVIVAAMAIPITIGLRRARAYQAALTALRARENPLMLAQDTSGARAEIVTLNGSRPLRLKRGLLGLTADSLLVVQARLPLDEVLRLPLAQVRWYGRPVKYHNGRNAIWLHFETPEGWRLVKLEMFRGVMADFVRVLKTLTPPELVTAYRRRRPYIHAGPLPAQPATQDLYGAWTLQTPVSLYLMPRALVFLEGVQVLRVIALDQIEEIGALRRMDAPGADGLLRFRAEQETLAFAVKDAETLAARVAEAARMNLEVPLWPKQKGKEDDWEWEQE